MATVAAPLTAQQDLCLDHTIAVNVVTENGDFVEGLTAQNFRGKLHGKRVETVSVSRDFGPRRVVIVLDASGSMEDKWSLEIFLARKLLSVDQDPSFALITFSTQVDDKIDFAAGRKRVSDELSALETPVHKRGIRKTALFDALNAAVDLLRPVQVGDAIILVTDGGENASKLTDSQSKNDLLGAGARLFALVALEATRRARTEETPAGPDWVRHLVAATGGDFTAFIPGVDSTSNFRRGSQVPGLLTVSGQQIVQFATVGFANEITGFYRVTLKLPQPLKKSLDWELKVVDPSGKANKHWRTVYPQKLAPCP